MGVLTCMFRLHCLMQQQSDIQYRLMQLTKKLNDLTVYSGAVGNGSISIGDLLSMPGSQMGRAMRYLGYAHNSSLQYMQQNEQGFMNWYSAQLGQAQSPQQQQQMIEWIRRSLYEQGRDRAMQVEQRNIKIEEDKIRQEKTKLETLQEEIKNEIEAAKKGRDEGIKDMTPKYVAGS